MLKGLLRRFETEHVPYDHEPFAARGAGSVRSKPM